MSPLQFLTLRRFQNWGCALLLATFWAPTHTLGPTYLDSLYSSRTTHRETGGARWLIAHFNKSMKGKSPWFFLQTLIEAQVQCLFYQWTFVVVQSLSRVQLLVTPWTAARQASLSFTTSWSFFANSCSLSQWYHPTISSSVSLFSSCPQSFPASGSFPVRGHGWSLKCDELGGLIKVSLFYRISVVHSWQQCCLGNGSSLGKGPICLISNVFPSWQRSAWTESNKIQIVWDELMKSKLLSPALLSFHTC